jgi:hypothetical protein
MAGTPVAHSQTPEPRRSHLRPLSRSPPWWAERRGRSERRTSEIVVERVVERVTSERVSPVGNFPVLMKTNYYDWAALMRVMLQARGLWDAVIVGTTDYMEDHLALEVIAKAVLRNVGVDWVRKAKASTLKREFDSLTFEASESIDDFGTCFSRITNQLAVLGFDYKEEEIVRRFLAVLPSKFKQIATSIETLCDLDMITVDELIGRLKSSEERINRNQGKSAASLNLTEDELVAWLSLRLKMSGNSGGDRYKESSSGGGKCGRGCGRGRGSSSDGSGGGRGGGDTDDRGGGNTGCGNGEGNSGIAKDECRYCGKKGHWDRECKKKKRDEEVHVTQAEEDEELTLFMASAAIIEPIAVQAHSAAVHLEESKLFAQLGENRGGDGARWILDSGATNHMTGVRVVFSEIDLRVHSTVRFGDGSVTNIEGRGTILIKCKTGGHKALTGVYYIPRLKANIVSLGQIEEAGYKIVLESGFLKLWDRAGTLAAKVKHGASRLYVLHLDMDWPVCLAAQGTSPAWRWHSRYDHLNFCRLKQLSEGEMMKGLPHIDHVDQVCDSYLSGK